MARLYADEDFPLPVVLELRHLGPDVRTVQEAGRAGQGIEDTVVLAEATSDKRAVLTHNHADFKRLNRQGLSHTGIVSCTQDPGDHIGLAQRIHSSIGQLNDLASQFIRITRPNPPTQP